MKRFLVCALTLCLTLPFAHASTTIRIATIAPDGTGWMKLMREAATQIQQETEDRVRIRYFPGGVQGSDKSVLRKIQIRQLQGGAVSSGSLVNISNMTQLYSLPFTFQTLDEIRAIRSEFDPLIAQALEDNGLTLLGLSEGGFAYLMSHSSFADASSFSDKKVWIPEGDMISQEIFKNGGVEPISLPISDVYTSLQTGLIDSLAANPTSVIALQWHTKLNYAADFPLAFLFGMLVVDSRTLQSLSEADRAIVKAKMREAFASMDLVNEQDEQAARAALIENGVEFQTLNADIQASWRQMAADSMAAFKEQDIYPVEVHEQLLKRLEQLRQ